MIEEEKKNLICSTLEELSTFSTKTRNERIAEGVSRLLKEEEKSVLKEIRNISDLRGELLHTINYEYIDVSHEVQYIEKILLKYIHKLSA